MYWLVHTLGLLFFCVSMDLSGRCRRHYIRLSISKQDRHFWYIWDLKWGCKQTAPGVQTGNYICVWGNEQADIVFNHPAVLVIHGFRHSVSPWFIPMSCTFGFFSTPWEHPLSFLNITHDVIQNIICVLGELIALFFRGVDSPGARRPAPCLRHLKESKHITCIPKC